MVKIVLTEAERHDASRVTRIGCRVGVLRQVVPEMLQRAFEVAAEQTPAAGATLEIEKEPVTVKCRQCGITDHSFDWQCNCSKCDSFDVEITGGSDLLITRMELETEHEDTNVAQRFRS
jgi:hydrogenase nickel incorporation protein HypA/HybF